MVAARSIKATGYSQRTPSPARTNRGCGVTTPGRGCHGSGTDQWTIRAHQPLLADHVGGYGLGVDAPELGAQPGAHCHLVDRFGEGVRVQFDDRAAL